MSVLDEGCVACIPTEWEDTDDKLEPKQILSMRTGKILEWRPRYVKVRLYNEERGRQEDFLLPKKDIVIIENPLYAVVNEPNSTMQRLTRKLALLDAVDEQTSSGKLDLIIQLPYVIKTQARKDQADRRRAEIERQLADGKYGIAYTDGTERITQLNRPVENNLMKQIEYLTGMLFSQLGMTQAILDGSADEKTMLNYHSRTIEPLVTAVVEEVNRKFLTREARQKLQKLIDDSSNSRNAIVKDWKDLGGRNDLIDGMWNIINGIENIFKTIGSAFREVFPPTTGQQLKDASAKFKEFTEGFKKLTENADVMETVKSVFKGIASAIDIVRKGISWILGRVAGLGKQANGIWDGFTKFIGKFGNFIASLRGSPAVNAFFKDVGEKLGAVGNKISEVLGGASKKVSGKISELYQKAKSLGIFQAIGAQISGFIGKIPDTIDRIAGFTKSIFDMIRSSKALNKPLTGIRNFFSSVVRLFSQSTSELGRSKEREQDDSIVSRIAGRYDSIVTALRKWFENAKANLGKAFEDAKAFFNKVLNEDIYDRNY